MSQGFWTPEKANRLVELLAIRPALSARQIAADLGTTRNAVIARCHRTGMKLGILSGFAPTKTAMVKERIKELAAKNLPQVLIAREIGVSEKVVSYHRRKLGLSAPNWWTTEGYGKKPVVAPSILPGAWRPKWVLPPRDAGTRARKTRERQAAERQQEPVGQYLERMRAQARRRVIGKAMGGSIAELQEIAAKSDVKVTKCPPGIEMGWLPSYLR